MSTPTKALPALALALVVSLSSCEMLFSGPEAEVDISPPSWILGVWENGDTGEAIEFTSTDVLFDGASLRRWAETNNLSIADSSSDNVDFDQRFSHAYWINSGNPGTDLSSGTRQFDAFRFIDPPNYVRVVVRPQFSGLSSIDFEQASTRSSNQSTRAGTDTADLNGEKP